MTDKDELFLTRTYVLLSKLDAILFSRASPTKRYEARDLSEWEDIDCLQEYIPSAQIPASVECLFRWQNGEEFDLWSDSAPFWSYVSAEDAVELIGTWNRLGAFSDYFGTDARIVLRDEDGWPSAWLPFICWNGDEFGIIACDQDNNEAVLGVNLQVGSINFWSANLDCFLESLVELYAKGGQIDIDSLPEKNTPSSSN